MCPISLDLVKEINKKQIKLWRLDNPKVIKKYNDTLHLTRKGEINKIKQELAKLSQFKSKCYVCLAKASKRGFTFHHKHYIENDVVRKNFQKNEKGTLEYYKALAPLIKKDPSRFLWVCNPHHQSITRLSRFNKENRKRLISAVRMST
jgi:hypothetical protein